MKTSKSQYGEMVKSVSPPSPKIKNCLCAFLTGGLICTFGQLLFNLYTSLGAAPDDGYFYVSLTVIVITAVLTGVGVFDKIAKFGGAGTLVPISGFANATVSPAIEFRAEGIITGVTSKIFIIAGPVIVFGLTAGVIYGVILYIVNSVK